MRKINPIILNLIKKSSDIDCNGKIMGEKEISIFNAMCKSFNINPDDFDENNDDITGLLNLEIHHTPKVEKKTDKNQTITITKEVFGKKVTFSYNQAVIEDWIIKNAVSQSKDKKIRGTKIFADIPKIRETPPHERSADEAEQLKRFDDLVKYIIEAGVEYGVDPNLITQIIHKETCFDGYSDEVFKAIGNGYMQLTSSPIKDMIGGSWTKEKGSFWEKYAKVKLYGPELRELLASRGFDNIDCDIQYKEKLKNDIFDAAKNRNDPEFNIRLGVLNLRYLLHHPDSKKLSQFKERYKADYNKEISLNSKEGKICQAAYRYNACDEHQVYYTKLVIERYREIIKQMKNFTPKAT